MQGLDEEIYKAPDETFIGPKLDEITAPRKYISKEEAISSLNDLLKKQSVRSGGDERKEFALNYIQKNKDKINEIGKEFNIPPEMIGAIILQEQYTQTSSDQVAKLLQMVGFKNASVGLGAVTTPAARAGWDTYNKESGGHVNLPDDSMELLKQLEEDDDFNLRSIAVYLRHVAKHVPTPKTDYYVIHSYDELNNLSDYQKFKLLSKYNGSDEYGEKVTPYLPYIQALLS